MSSGEERKLVTVLFADLVGSTAYADDRDPERVRVQLDRFYDAMRDEIERTGGTVEKFAGDAVMAVFGAPAALEDHAERALHAALAMQERLAQLFQDELEMRIGVNTGEVVVGAAREGGSFVTGDVVNVADRLQKAADPGEVLAGERTVAAADGAFELGASRTVEAKGKAGGVVATPVHGAIRTSRARGVGGLPRVFVGRDSELELLRATYRRAAAQSEPHLVTLVGEPGVGKSRLVQELWGVLAGEEPRPVVRTGRCLAYGDGITYWPLGDIVREHFRIREGMEADEVANLLEGREMLGLALGLDAASELHPLDARERLHAAAVEFVEDVAAHGPAALLVEDVHWAEPDLLDLLERLVSDVRAPVLLLATARPEFFDERPAWASGKRNATALWLDALSAEAVSQLLERKLPAMPADLRDLVVKRADGNPFFVEELVGDLLDSGVLVQTEDGWARGDGDAGFAMPDTVHAVLAARIDRLPEAEKAALQAGAVIGRVFWRGPVLHLLDLGEPDFGLLEERDLVASRRESTLTDDREYVIKHALTREVAYGSIPKARRGRLHARFAEWLEGSGSGLDERASMLAYHYSEAASPENADLVWQGEPNELVRVRGRAVHWLRRAAELAKRRSEFDEAVVLLTRAVDLCDDPHEGALLWVEIGLANALRFDGDAFWSAMETALDGLLDDEERAQVYSMLAFQTSNRSGMWGVQTVPELVDGWADRALELAAPESDARARALIARVNIEPSGRAEDAELAGVLAEASGDSCCGRWLSRCERPWRRTRADTRTRRLSPSSGWHSSRRSTTPTICSTCTRRQVRRSAWSVGSTRRVSKRSCTRRQGSRLRLTTESTASPSSVRSRTPPAAGRRSRPARRTSWTPSEGNLETPCTRNARSLLIAAVALLATGREALALEARALELAHLGWSAGGLASPGVRLGLLRGDRDEIKHWLDMDVFRMHVYGPGVMTSRLDALAALRDRTQVEDIAPAYVEDGLFLEPFALRALGIVRGDDELLERADRLLAERGLEWHRSQTERLLAGF